MKTFFYFLVLFALLPIVSPAQYINPTCNQLLVENMQMDNDTTNLIKVTVSNSCTNCTLYGCVYVEIRLISSFAPFDTLASSQCMSHISPDANKQRTYNVSSFNGALPTNGTFRLSFKCGAGDGCDSVPFRYSLGIPLIQEQASIRIYPNPADRLITIMTPASENMVIRLLDLSGRLLFETPATAGHQNINLDPFARGLYLVEILKDNYRLWYTAIIRQ